MSEDMVPAPSDEAIEAAVRECTRLLNDEIDGNDAAKEALGAAYPIDYPRIRAEERARILREVEMALNRWRSEAEQIGHHSLVDTYKTVQGALAAHFNPEAA